MFQRATWQTTWINVWMHWSATRRWGEDDLLERASGEERSRDSKRALLWIYADITAAVRKTWDFEGLTSEWPFPAGVCWWEKMFAEWHWRTWSSAPSPLRLPDAANLKCWWLTLKCHMHKGYAQGKAVWRKRLKAHISIFFVCKNNIHSKNKKTKKTSRHTTGFIQKPNYLTLLTLIFFDNSFFLNSSSLSTDRKQTVYNRSNPYSTKHSQGKNEQF